MANAPPKLKRKKQSSLPPSNRQSLGQHGETLAASYLQAKNYQILHRNVRFPVGEIDIVAVDGNELVFVEVKTRQSEWFGHPAEAVNPRKLSRLRKAISAYLQQYPSSKRFRIDVVSVLPGKIEHFENVTV